MKDDTISRQAAIEQINCWIGSGEYRYTNATEYLTKRITSLLSVSAEKTDAYKQGWHDVITAALKETHNVYTEEGSFRVVQEETLIGLGMAYEQVSTEKTGQWIEVDVRNCHATLKCSVCDRVIKPTFTFGEYSYEDIKKFYPYCHCGAKMVEPQESEVSGADSN